MKNSYFTLEVLGEPGDRFCDFVLWLGATRFSKVRIDYPCDVINSYKQWFNAYRDYYYLKFRMPRASGGGAPLSQEELRDKLRQADAALRTKFHNWLESKELEKIKTKIKEDVDCYEGHSFWVYVFLYCSRELARLPWESWEISKELGVKGKILLNRSISHISNSSPKTVKPIGRKARVLAIFGYDPNLDFSKEEKFLKSHSRVLEVRCLGLQKLKKEPDALKEEICQAIADERGWDILFFAGHSYEHEDGKKSGFKGEFQVSSDVCLSINDIQTPVQEAIKKGLQFAIFNSCRGMDIAESLITIGLSQVLVMREPIHNEVAVNFFVAFFEGLVKHEDVGEALVKACKNLKEKKAFKFPSADLIPSLFRSPGSELFKIEPFGIKEQLKVLVPIKRDWQLLAPLMLASLFAPLLQDYLLDERVKNQAVYRDVTEQTITGEKSPILLVQIDNESIRKADILDPNPMSREYLAKLVNRLSELDAKLVGIDYYLDRYQSEEKRHLMLSNALQTAVEEKKTWFVFPFLQNRKGDLNVHEKFASLNWSLEGDIRIDPKHKYVDVFWGTEGERPPTYRFPFSYMLAFAYELQSTKNNDLPQLNLNSDSDFYRQLYDYREELFGEGPLFDKRAYLSDITYFSRKIKQLQQTWLNPIIDYSLANEEVYQCIPAWKLLEKDGFAKNEKKEKCEVGSVEDLAKEGIVIIASGEYDEAQDNFKPTPAFRYRTDKTVLTGGEIHAYTLHHLLTNRFVIGVPDFFLVILGFCLGKKLAFIMEYCPKKRGLLVLVFWGGNLVYAVASLQLYISKAILLPIVLPSLAFWAFCLRIKISSWFSKNNN